MHKAVHLLQNLHVDLFLWNQILISFLNSFEFHNLKTSAFRDVYHDNRKFVGIQKWSSQTLAIPELSSKKFARNAYELNENFVDKVKTFLFDKKDQKERKSCILKPT